MSRLNPSALAVPPNGIREIGSRAVARPAGSVVRLEQGEPSFLAPAHVRAAASAAADGRVAYTPSTGVVELRERIADRLRARYPTPIQVEQVVVSQGAVEAIYIALAAVVRPGDDVLIPDPAWPTYEAQVLSLGGRPATYPLRRERGFLPDIEDVRRAITPRTRAMILNSPSNPTGSVVDAETLEQLVTLAASRDILVISDEVYDDIVFDGDHVTARMFAPESVVSVFSFSKTYSMTGWRVGYAAIPTWMEDAVARLQEMLLSCISTVSQVAALAALEGPQDSIVANLAAYRERRDLAVGLLRDRGVVTTSPGGAFYLLVPLRSGVDSRAAALELVANGVAVAPGTAFGRTVSDHIRLSLASSPEDLTTGIGRLMDWYDTTAGGAVLVTRRPS